MYKTSRAIVCLSVSSTSSWSFNFSSRADVLSRTYVVAAPSDDETSSVILTARGWHLLVKSRMYTQPKRSTEMSCIMYMHIQETDFAKLPARLCHRYCHEPMFSILSMKKKVLLLFKCPSNKNTVWKKKKKNTVWIIHCRHLSYCV